ncbi:pentatricopeptide repeat domain-containing protein 3, mitochondrial isoform X1 [Amblyraja radiata]|uniref:pentatricopeptide repeat domain-containing protein 3, mitochondrial isoform X1 n=1 Tax=Amblyraja radiata TaxID=386614 RepID=UPI00140237EE|nr:pentatricopeptide repeat domain-containing protein 3, mitochondrial isoform X1 [Amblyraja radiata]
MAAPCVRVCRQLVGRSGASAAAAATGRLERGSGGNGNNNTKAKAHRYYSTSPLLCQCVALKQTDSAEEIVIPRKKTWDKLAVLHALAATVNRDPTAPHYRFQDDPYLIPRTSPEFRLYSLSQESGCYAAKYIVNTYPKFFQKDFAEPSIPCLMPQQLEPLLNEVTEEALKECIQLRRVKDSVDLYDQLVQAGTPVCLETTNTLLDLLCVYGDQEPPRENQLEAGAAEDQNEVNEDPQRRRRGRLRKATDLLTVTWRENNNAERIFNLMPERNEHTYCAMIRGMVKYAAYTKAVNMYTDLLNNRMRADVHAFNALISAVPELKEAYNEKIDFILELLKQMAEQKVQPNLLTFNSALKSLRRCGSNAKGLSLQIINEMKFLNIEPSLATFDHLLGIFYKPAASSQLPIDVIFSLLDEIEGKLFEPKDPDDVNFFISSMKVCMDLKDLELAYRIHNVLETGDNWKLLGDSYQRSIYYGRFFNIVCMMESIDVVLKWYKNLIPSVYYPNVQGVRDLLQALDTENQLQLVPSIWKDIKRLGHGNKQDLVEEVLELMGRDKHSPELQVAFADTAVDIMSLYKQTQQRNLQWTATSLGKVTALILRGGKTRDAWEMLPLFKANNRVPSKGLLDEFLNHAKESSNKALALDLVKLAGSFSLPAIAEFLDRVTTDFDLTEEERRSLDDLDASSSSSGSSSSSESDSDRE